MREYKPGEPVVLSQKSIYHLTHQGFVSRQGDGWVRVEVECLNRGVVLVDERDGQLTLAKEGVEVTCIKCLESWTSIEGQIAAQYA